MLLEDIKNAIKEKIEKYDYAIMNKSHEFEIEIYTEEETIVITAKRL